LFPTVIGTPSDPRNTLRAFAAIAQRAGVVWCWITHSEAQCSLSVDCLGPHIKVGQELLGHSSYGITADIYSHVAIEQQREAAERLGEAFPR
jgi:hypothetical protein